MQKDLNQPALCLPKTDFPMKANLPQKEPLFIQQWKEKNIYSKILEKQKGKKFFSFVDGPPYANGKLHVGHALNKILKDIVVKYMNLSGRYCPFVPIWDCHGLPIEISAMKKLKDKSGSSSKQIRELCRKEAHYWVGIQKQQFERLGVLADWNKPLLTLYAEYEAEQTRALAQLAEKQLLYRGKKPVYWCFALRTAIASSEVEYREHKSPSIYVKFPAPEVAQYLKLKKRSCSFVIWTTTPWTLPANQAICLHPKFQYRVFDSGEDFLILAVDAKKNFEENTGLKLKPVTTHLGDSFSGTVLEKQKAIHPFVENKDSVIVLGDYVTKTEGTGCVHTAPGHGLDDFITGAKYELPITVPVDSAGRFTEEVSEWKGLNVFQANPLIIDRLEKNNCLLGKKEITHSYPFNPRSGKPLIFRATDQWFIEFDKKEYSIRKKALSEIENNIQFYPDWGRRRLRAMIQNSPDWCLSRQRHWGVPIPVFYCRACEAPLLSMEIISCLADQMESSKEGIEYWFSRTADELLPKNIKCTHCKKSNGFKKGEDIIDVWFDSGICHYVLKKIYGDHTFPADIYLEGSDQHRGWFQTSLNASIALSGKSPFKALLTHCFVNDAQGNKMSKSKGNVVHLEKVIQQRGAEILRLWATSEDYSQDLQAGDEIFNRITEAYRRFRNTLRFMLGNLQDFDPDKNMIAFSEMNKLDQWILNQLAVLIDQMHIHYENFQFHKIYQDLNVFFTTQLSALYLDVLKDRLYTFKKEGKARRSGQSAIYLMLEKLLSSMSPIMTFLCEEAYQYMPGKKEESILLTDFPSVPKEWIDFDMHEKFELMLKIRQKVFYEMENMRKQQVIGSSLESSVTIHLPNSLFTDLSPLADTLKELLIVSVLDIQPTQNSQWTVEMKKAPGHKCVRCWHYSEQLNNKKICLKCLNNL